MDGWIDDALYAQIERVVPIVCVDFILRRTSTDGQKEYALARRDSPFGEVWCHFGGRMRFGETIPDALRRHLRETIAGATVHVSKDVQPACVFPWFPDDVLPQDGTLFGRDPRKHAIGLGFVLDVEGDPQAIAGGEARTIEFFTTWPEDLWPGCRTFFNRLLA